MNNTYCTTNEQKHERGQHLKAEERGAVQSLKRLGYSNRAIARELNCSTSTIGYELKRGTTDYKGRGRKPQYSAKRGAKTYRENRKKCRRPRKIKRDLGFIKWMVEQILNHKWSFDVCVGYGQTNHH